jgi:hypothetical protein
MLRDFGIALGLITVHLVNTGFRVPGYDKIYQSILGLIGGN